MERGHQVRQAGGNALVICLVPQLFKEVYCEVYTRSAQPIF